MKTEKALMIFDHDGTLHDSMHVFLPAMELGIEWLRKNGYPDIPNFPSERIAQCLGLNSNDIWKSLVGEIPPETVRAATKVVADDMSRRSAEGKAKWFDGVNEMLDALKAEGHHIVMLSNVETQLAENYWKCFGMERWFDKIYDCESYDFKPKSEIIKYIMEDYGHGPAIMVGDRLCDLECAREVNAKFIGCLYGFCEEGELNDADALVKSPAEIVEAVKELS